MPSFFTTLFPRAVRRFKRIGARLIPPPSLPGPKEKQKPLLAHAQQYGLKILVETGTCFGDTIDALHGDFEQIISIEG